MNLIDPGLLLQNRYRVVQKLGEGGHCETWQVDDGGKKKVMKVLLDDYPKLIELFQREAEVLKQLNHPGIPKVEPDGYFTFQPQGATKQLHCLVMEFIEGQDLEKWLAQQNNKPITQEEAIDWLKQLVKILAQVHDSKYFHRDIKPSNIMRRSDGQLVLIDFGAVREVTLTYIEKYERQEVTRVCTPEYAAPEQFKGQAIPESDFFALGRTFVFLLTGKKPKYFEEDPQTLQFKKNWQKSAPQISKPLADLINKLMASLPGAREANTKKILDKLASLERRGGGKRIVGLGLVGALGLAALASYELNQQKQFPKPNDIEVTQVPPKVSNSVDSQESCPLDMGDHLSCGEESLLSGEILPEKKQGIAAFAQGNYPQAIKSLESAREKDLRDPEILIYLNNARIAAKKASHYTIAVAAPLNTGTDERNNIGLEMLRGVAQAQNEVNNNGRINGKMLRVAIVDDGGKVDQGKEIAKSLGYRDNILAVVGHYSSKLTTGVDEVYQQNKLVLISPTSTSVELSAAGDFFFRTVPNNRVIALALVQQMVHQVRQGEAAVFYNSKSPYSKDLYNQFYWSGAKVLNDTFEKVLNDTFDLSNPDFDAESAVAEAERLGAKMLVLFPDVTTREKARAVVKANQGRYCMIAGASLHNDETLNEVAKEAENRLVVATHWQREDSPNPEFPKQADDLWQGQVSMRTALAYDATRAAITALANKSQANRSSVQQALADPKFKTSGATGTISFQPNGDRNEQTHLLTTVVKSGVDYKFVPIAQAPPLECDHR